MAEKDRTGSMAGDKLSGDYLSLENLFLMGSDSSPRKWNHFVDKAKDNNEPIPLPPVFPGINKDRCFSWEETAGDQFAISRVKRGFSASNDEAEDLPKRKPRDLSVDLPDWQMESPLSTPKPSPRNILVHASPRVIRTRSEDGSLEQEFKLSTPIVRHSRSLALRRVTSMVYTSPQFQLTSPSSSARRRCSYENKPSPLGRLKSEDRMSEGSSSGRESMCIETDEDVGRVESLSDDTEMEVMKSNEVQPPPQPFGKRLDYLTSAASRRISFRQQRQVSDLFEDDSPKVTASDIAFLQSQDKGDDSPTEFKLSRRRNETSPTEGAPNSSGREKRWRAGIPGLEYYDSAKTLARCSHSMPVVMEGGSLAQDQRIRSAVDTFCRYDSDVIADGSVPYALPCFRGKKEELMFITCHTLAEVVQGRYDNVLDHHEIIDCRYPYEYEGGHIAGALNMFQAENIGEIMSWKDQDSKKRNVLIFHCEFSSQRAPAMMRLLRSTDRQHNADCYPYLCHPEIYLLEGGYKEFYSKNSHLCDPQSYIPMVHSAHASDLKKFLARSTSWHGKDLRFSKRSHTLVI